MKAGPEATEMIGERRDDGMSVTAFLTTVSIYGIIRVKNGHYRAKIDGSFCLGGAGDEKKSRR